MGRVRPIGGPDELVELAAFLELHAEVASPIALADFVDRNDPRMLKAGGRLGLAAEPLQMGFTRAMAETNNLKRNEAVETFLARAIDDALAAAPDFLQELVITELRQDRFVIRR
jgi:hypothetical protein